VTAVSCRTIDLMLQLQQSTIVCSNEYHWYADEEHLYFKLSTILLPASRPAELAREACLFLNLTEHEACVQVIEVGTEQKSFLASGLLVN
jgi:hypothetical protein